MSHLHLVTTGPVEPEPVRPIPMFYASWPEVMAAITIEVACPLCEAGVGERCVDVRTVKTTRRVVKKIHPERFCAGPLAADRTLQRAIWARSSQVGEWIAQHRADTGLSTPQIAEQWALDQECPDCGAGPGTWCLGTEQQRLKCLHDERAKAGTKARYGFYEAETHKLFPAVPGTEKRVWPVDRYHYSAQASFHLITYASYHDDTEIVMWNGRNGGVPFTLISTRPDGTTETLRRVRCYDEPYVPDHRPEPGEWIFTDPPQSERPPELNPRMPWPTERDALAIARAQA